MFNDDFYEISASAHTGDQTIDEYPDISGITTARVRFAELFSLDP